MEHEDGKRTLLSKTDANQRQAIAKRLLTPSTDIRTSVSPCKKVMVTALIFNFLTKQVLNLFTNNLNYSG